MLLLLFSVVVSAFNPQNCGIAQKNVEKRLTKRVIGGHSISHSEMPWLVAIQQYGQTVCTGSLISDRHVLTAAHCFERGCRLKPIKIMRVCHGTSRNDNPCQGPGAVEYGIKKMYNHESFFKNECLGRDDYIVLELDSPVQNAVPVCIPTDENGGPMPRLSNTNLYSAGYAPNVEIGQFEIRLPLGRNFLLRFANVGMRVACDPPLEPGTLCARQTSNGAICQGDSGGPLMEIRNGRFTIVGVHSMLSDDAQCTPHGIFQGKVGKQTATDVGCHIPEILETLNVSSIVVY